ncbi:MAG: ArsR/SmtB family transcription factor [Candidatus Nanohaloarchaea archaeon]
MEKLKYNQQYAMEGKHRRFLKTLANPTRFSLIMALRDGPKNVTELEQAVGREQSTVSNNLQRLRDCGFVAVEKEGQHRIYRLNDETIEPLLGLIDEHTEQYCRHCMED